MARGPSTPRKARRGIATLRAFALYGEASSAAPQLHIESIHARSRWYNWEIDAHVHHGLHQVVWLVQGTVDARLDETRTQAVGPVAVVIPPGVAHAFRFSRDSDGFVLTLNATSLTEGDARDTGEALQSLFSAPRTLALDPASPEVARVQALFEALHAESQSGDSERAPVPTWLARAVIWRLAQLCRVDDAAVRRRGRAVKSLYTRWVVLLESHYREQWPVSRYARTLGLSCERLNRMVRAETGHNALALLHTRLTREACRRLVHVAAPVSKLAFELGFEDPAYFCRFFKRQTGMSPSDYRTRALQSN
jgi:AraC family transcriptional activator of pobA